MPLWPNFIGGAYKSRSTTFANELAINVYLETSKSKANSKRSFMYGTPGMRERLETVGVSCRGVFSQDGRTFAVIGSTLYEIATDTWTATDLGNVTAGSTPVSMASNGRGGEQLAIVSGGDLWILDLLTNALTMVATPATNDVVIVIFIDGYFLLLEADTIRVWFSALEDGTSWDALDFFARSETADNLVGMVALKNRAWVFGSQTTEVFYNTGDADSPWQPYPGTVIQEGATTPYAITVIGETVAWLAQDNQGNGRIVAASNYQPETISTPAIDFALSQLPTLTDMEVLAYEQEGHQFAAFTSPSGDVTYVFDVVEQEWHQRAASNLATGLDMRWRARGCASTPNGLVVGDFDTGQVYTLDLGWYTDGDDGMIRRTRRAPYLANENQWLFLDQFELGVEPGVGLSSGQGSDPVIELRISRDGGNTWESAGDSSPGAIGDHEARAVWAALGRSRADRLVLETVQTDPVKTAWGPGAWIRVTPGTGQL